MKTSIKFLMTISIIMLFATFASCSKTNDPNPPTEFDDESQAIIDKYSDLRIWYGHWDSKNRNTTGFTFNSDGTCSTESDNGVWKYNPVTKLLSTTISNWTWTINLLTPTEWSGTLEAGQAYSYSRNGGLEHNPELLIGTWIYDDVRNEVPERTITFKSNNEYIYTKSDTCLYGTYEIREGKPGTIDEYVIILYEDIHDPIYFRTLNGYEIGFETTAEKEMGLVEAYKRIYNFIYSDFIE